MRTQQKGGSKLIDLTKRNRWGKYGAGQSSYAQVLKDPVQGSSLEEVRLWMNIINIMTRFFHGLEQTILEDYI